MRLDIFLFGTLLIAGFAAALSYVLAFASTRWARRLGAMDQPSGGRKIHTHAIPLFGGVGVALAILVGVGLLSAEGLLSGMMLRQIVGFAAGVVILLIGGITDDVKARPPSVQIIFPVCAALAILVSGTGILQVTNPSGGALSLVWWRWDAFDLSLPADLITIAWLLFATYATKLLDGLDGLVSGLAAIGSTVVGALTLSPAYFQPGVAFLSAAVGGAFLGFLPRNVNPAKQFLGESGSTLAGFSLGFLAIVSSAKVAIALAVLAVPLADAILVVIRRMLRGSSPWKGDDTHLHFRLLRAGVPHRTAVTVLWMVSLCAGLLALSLQTRGKLFLVGGLALLTGLASWVANRFAARRTS